MSRKIFISYRRQDTGANALGIGQYLEHEFGRKNVFIDVDMRAGAKFPKVLEQRLAECKVMLVLIGPDWLKVTDEQGQRRLDDPDDWVRLEIAQAIHRNITVIPVRVNGAELPTKAKLPNDIRGLLDHQAVSVTLAGFRNEMVGLVRDIRSIPSPWPWRRVGTIAAGLLLLLTVFVFVQVPNSMERIRFVILSGMSGSVKHDSIWDDTKPGEWVQYETLAGKGSVLLSYQFSPASVRIIGDRVSYEARYALEPEASIAPENATLQGAYEEATYVIDCKQSQAAMAEKTTYSSAKQVISRFKWGDPESLDLKIGVQIPPRSILAVAQLLLCNEHMRMPLLSKEQGLSANMKYLTRTSTGDGDVFYGTTKSISDSDYTAEIIAMIKNDVDHPLNELAAGKTILGLPRGGFRTRADRIQFNCKDRKLRDLKFEYYDSKSNLVALTALLSPEPVVVPQNSPFESLLIIACGVPVPKVQGTYEGTNIVTLAKGGQGEHKISIVVEQTGSELNVNFVTASGQLGNGTGKLTGSVVETMSLQNTTPGCPGSYDASIKFADDTVSWSLKGQDCAGHLEGHGTAKRTKL